MNDLEKEFILNSANNCFFKPPVRDGILRQDESFYSKTPCKTDEDGITLYTSWDSEYFIAWGRINTLLKLISWIHHLSSKNWVNRKTIQFLIEEASEKFDWNYIMMN